MATTVAEDSTQGEEGTTSPGDGAEVVAACITLQVTILSRTGLVDSCTCVVFIFSFSWMDFSVSISWADFNFSFSSLRSLQVRSYELEFVGKLS